MVIITDPSGLPRLLGENTADKIELQPRQLRNFSEGLLTRGGDDTIIGSADPELVYGGKGRDAIDGRGGNDRLYGDTDNDFLVGDEGDDRVQGGKGNDSLFGNSGNDTLIGDRGGDVLTGGEGTDAFVLDANLDGFDIITDFVVGEDRLVFASGFNPEFVTFSPGTGLFASRPGDTIVSDRLTGQPIAVVQNVPSNVFRSRLQSEILQQSGELTTADPILPASGSVYDEYRFDGRPGQLVTILLESLDFDPYVTVFDPNGSVIAENDDISQDNPNAALALTLPTIGAYRVIVTSFDRPPDGQGNYNLTIKG